MTGQTRRDWLWLGAILALAAALRIWGLNAPMWHDEIQTLVTHLNLGWGEMVQSYSMNHHYLHNILSKASMAVFGERSLGDPAAGDAVRTRHARGPLAAGA